MAKAKTTQTSTNVAQTEQVATPAPAVNTQEAAPKAASKRVAKKTEQVAESVATPAVVAAPAIAAESATVVESSTKAKRSSKKTEQVAESVATPAVVAESATVVESSTKAKRSSKKTEKVAAPVAESTPAVSAASSESTEAVATEHVSVEDRIAQIVSANEHFSAAQKEINVLLKRAQKLYVRETKEAAIQQSRSQARRARAQGEDGERKRSGFSSTPTLLSDGICTFLNIPVGSRLPRTDVNKLVTAYIKTNKLENPSNRRSFIPDNKLQTLLGPLQDKHKEGGYSYFNIQTYLAQHFLKTEKSQTVAASQ